MGKIRAAYRDQLDDFENDWQMFRRSLVQMYQPHWDKVIRQARQYVMAAGNQNPVEPKWALSFPPRSPPPLLRTALVPRFLHQESGVSARYVTYSSYRRSGKVVVSVLITATPTYKIHNSAIVYSSKHTKLLTTRVGGRVQVSAHSRRSVQNKVAQGPFSSTSRN